MDDDKCQITYTRISDIVILASRVNAIGEFFNFIRPDEIIGDVQDLYHSFGEILCEAAKGIHKIAEDADEEYIRQRKADTATISEQ